MSDNADTSPRVAVLATLDTKGDEARFLGDELEKRGIRPLLVDISLVGDSPSHADISRSELARHGATGGDRVTAMETTAAAAAIILEELVMSGRIAGVVGIGGGTGGWISQRAVEGLPFGFPKVVVTTVIKSSGEHDILFLPSVVDIAGLNGLLRSVLRQAAGALSGMVTNAHSDNDDGKRSAVALTMFGVTTAGGDVARRTLEEAGYEVVVFHATGAGGRTMERLLYDGHFSGALDWTTTEIVQNIAGGLCDAGPDRLRAAAASGVPQVVVPGAVDVINVLPPIPEAFAGRAHHWHLPTVPLVRTSPDENAAVGRWIGDRLRNSTSGAIVMIPRRGFSSLDAPGGEFEDAAADIAFEEAVRASSDGAVEVIADERHINDPEFARAAALRLLDLLKSADSEGRGLNTATAKE